MARRYSLRSLLLGMTVVCVVVGFPAAIYWRDEGGTYSCLAGPAGTTEAAIDADDVALVRLRLERAAVAPEAGKSALSGALALPMHDHSELNGFAVIGDKPRAVGYRPDEIAALEQSVQQVGLSLGALGIRALRSRTAQLEVRVTELQALLNRIAPDPC